MNGGLGDYCWRQRVSGAALSWGVRGQIRGALRRLWTPLLESNARGRKASGVSRNMSILLALLTLIASQDISKTESISQTTNPPRPPPAAQVQSPSNSSFSSSSPTATKTFNPSPGPTTSTYQVYPHVPSPPPLLLSRTSSWSQLCLGDRQEATEPRDPLLPNNPFSQQPGPSF